MVTNVTSLLKTVKAVEDEATRGTRALEATIECIKQEMSVRTFGGNVHGQLMLNKVLDDSKVIFCLETDLMMKTLRGWQTLISSVILERWILSLNQSHF